MQNVYWMVVTVRNTIDIRVEGLETEHVSHRALYIAKRGLRDAAN